MHQCPASHKQQFLSSAMSTATIWYLLVRNDFSGPLPDRNLDFVEVPDSASIAKLAKEIKKNEQLSVASSQLNVWKLVDPVNIEMANKSEFFTALERYDGGSEGTEQKAKAMYPHGPCAWRVRSKANIKLLGECTESCINALIQLPAAEGMSYPHDLHVYSARSFHRSLRLESQLTIQSYVSLPSPLWNTKLI
jgi:hypothetical protein